MPADFVGATADASVGAAIVGDADVAGATVEVGVTAQATKTNESATPKTILSRAVKGCEVFVIMNGILLQKKKSVDMGRETTYPIQVYNNSQNISRRHTMKQFVPFFLALSLLAMLTVPAFAEETQQTCSAEYTVQRGDTLYSIGVKYGVDWRNIFYANGITNVLKLPVGKVLCIPAATATAPVATSTPTATTTVAATPSAKIPIITITGVVPGESVTINATNFPPNRDFNVLMGPIGTRGESGTFVTTVNTGTGAFTATYTLPDSLKSAKQVAIRLEGEFGYHSYNWFYNK